jgi:hypothetical protein
MADGTIVWALHQDCLFVRRMEERGTLPQFEHQVRSLLNSLSPRLLGEIVKTYRAVDAISISPYGENRYLMVKEINHVEVQARP